MVNRFCPDCNTVLVPQTYGGITLDVCPSCAGMWFDEDELNRIMRADPAQLLNLEDQHAPAVEKLSETPRMRSCPSCKSPLFRYNYLYSTPIELDACEKCNGIWVDDGELEKMVQALGATKTEVVPGVVQKQVELVELEAESREDVRQARGLTALFNFLRMRPRI